MRTEWVALALSFVLLLASIGVVILVVRETRLAKKARDEAAEMWERMAAAMSELESLLNNGETTPAELSAAFREIVAKSIIPSDEMLRRA